MTADAPACLVRLAKMVRKARERRGWTQATLAEAVHVPVTTLAQIEEAAVDLPLTVAVTLAQVLELSVAAIVFNQHVAKRVRP